MAYRQINLNPEQKRVGDCTVRAIAAATHQNWAAVYAGLALAGFELHDMPSANYVWGCYLRRCGWSRSVIPNNCPDCYTVAQFAKDHPDGTYISMDDGRDSLISRMEDIMRWADSKDREVIQRCIDTMRNS